MAYLILQLTLKHFGWEAVPTTFGFLKIELQMRYESKVLDWRRQAL